MDEIDVLSEYFVEPISCRQVICMSRKYSEDVVIRAQWISRCFIISAFRKVRYTINITGQYRMSRSYTKLYATSSGLASRTSCGSFTHFSAIVTVIAASNGLFIYLYCPKRLFLLSDKLQIYRNIAEFIIRQLYSRFVEKSLMVYRLMGTIKQLLKRL